ncbi:MAG: hypothetical protein HC880_16285, partial [Bacteroidia bacterium]|nr:hypothetical protein [Bacteroidia bacterium]
QVFNRFEPLELKAGTSKFEIDFAALSFLAPSKVRYRYKLSGTRYQEDWVEAPQERGAYYTNLPPGQYRFQVQAANNDGVWNREGAVLEFYLAPFFYQTTWFYLLSALTLVFPDWAFIAGGFIPSSKAKRPWKKAFGKVPKKSEISTRKLPNKPRSWRPSTTLCALSIRRSNLKMCLNRSSSRGYCSFPNPTRVFSCCMIAPRKYLVSAHPVATITSNNGLARNLPGKKCCHIVLPAYSWKKISIACNPASTYGDCHQIIAQKPHWPCKFVPMANWTGLFSLIIISLLLI